MLEKRLKLHEYFIYQMKMRHKLLITYTILILFPLTIFYFVLFSKISNIIQSNAKFSSAHSFEQAYSFLSYKIHKIKKSSDFVVYNSTVRDILDNPGPKAPMYKQLDDLNTLSIFLSSIEEDQEIKKTTLYIPDGLIYIGQSPNIFDFSTVKNTSWYRSFIAKNYSITFFPSYHFKNSSSGAESRNTDNDGVGGDGTRDSNGNDGSGSSRDGSSSSNGSSDNSGSSSNKEIGSGSSEDDGDVLSVIRFFNSTNNFAKHLGILRLDFSKASIEKIISNANALKGSITFLQNSSGEIIASSDYNKGKPYSSNLSTFVKLSDENTFKEIKLNDEMTLTRAIHIPESDWYMVTVVPKIFITKEAENYRNYMLILFFTIGTIAYILAYTIAHFIIKRISLLQKQMKKFENGDFNAVMPTIGHDEIGSLTESYNYMIKKISILVEDQRLSAIKLKNSELKALQAQINPHFLYNSLEMINCFSYQNKHTEVNTIIQELALFYKLSLNKGNDMIPLTDEIQHVSAYVNIQNLRFHDKITLKTNIEETLKTYKIPKIILQPIIENSILHGILEKDSKYGTIVIDVKCENNQIVLTISDDGVGMPEDTLAALNSINDSFSHAGNYGIRNVSERIKLFYGDSYGLVYQSRLGYGTIVTIRLPMKG